MRTFAAARPGAPMLVLAHGAGAGENHPWMARVAAGLSERAVSVVTFDFPYMQAGRRLPDPGATLEEAFQAVWQEVAAANADVAPGPARLFAGGKSMGGRIATQTAARGRFVPPPAGVVCFGYPLHPPGKPAQRRDRHLPEITVPLLFVHGTRDVFGSAEEMETLTSRLPTATLELVQGGDHSLQTPKRPDPTGAAFERALDAAAAWIIGRRG